MKNILLLISYFSRFISEIEAVCRRWLADGPKNLLVCSELQINLTSDNMFFCFVLYCFVFSLFFFFFFI